MQHPTPLRDLSASLLYPIGLWDQGVDGQTIVMVHVTDMGAVDSTYVANSSGFRAFDSVAAAGLKQARFVPARRGERRIAMWVRVPVRFSHDPAVRARARAGGEPARGAVQ